MDNMVALAEKSGAVADIISGMMLGQMGAAAERAQLAGEVVRFTQQNDAVLAVMGRLEEQRLKLASQLASVDPQGPLATMLRFQLAQTEGQQRQLLERAGCPALPAHTPEPVEPAQVVEPGMVLVAVPKGKPVYVREGKKYERVAKG